MVYAANFMTAAPGSTDNPHFLRHRRPVTRGIQFQHRLFGIVDEVVPVDAMRSVGRKYPSFLASAALVATLARAMVSKVRLTSGWMSTWAPLRAQLAKCAQQQFLRCRRRQG